MKLERLNYIITKPLNCYLIKHFISIFFRFNTPNLLDESSLSWINLGSRCQKNPSETDPYNPEEKQITFHPNPEILNPKIFSVQSLFHVFSCLSFNVRQDEFISFV
jgi:hypothetical protein